MKELKTYSEYDKWVATKKRIGFIGSNKTVELQCNIWTMELYENFDGGFSILITLDSDESWIVCDFDKT